MTLLSTAGKFTPAGGAVELSASGDEDAGLVRFEVRDDGPGIAAEDLPKLFQPFTQLDTRLSREHAGSGLGLALVNWRRSSRRRSLVVTLALSALNFVARNSLRSHLLRIDSRPPP